MDRFDCMKALVTAIDEGGFAAAGRKLGLSRVQVSRLVTALENHLGAQLLVRTTRTMVLTEAGQVFAERARVLVSDLEDVEAASVDAYHVSGPESTQLVVNLSRKVLGHAGLFIELQRRRLYSWVWCTSTVMGGCRRVTLSRVLALAVCPLPTLHWSLCSSIRPGVQRRHTHP